MSNLVQELAIATLEGERITSGLKPGVSEDVAAEMGRHLATIGACIAALHDTSGPSPDAHVHVTKMQKAVDYVVANQEVFSDPHAPAKLQLLSFAVSRMNDMCYAETRSNQRAN